MFTPEIMELANTVFGTSRVNELFHTSFPFANDENIFRSQVLAEGVFVKKQELANAVDKKKALVKKYSDKINEIQSEYERRIPPAYIDMVISVKGQKVTVNELDYVKSLEVAIASLNAEVEGLNLLLANIEALKDILPAVNPHNVPARVVSRSILRLKDSLKTDSVPAFADCVSACKLWHTHNANHAGRQNTFDNEYKRMKDSLESFMNTFALTSEESASMGFKKVYINLNQKEIVELACNVFTGKFIRNTKVKGEYEFKLTTEGRVAYEVELINLLVMKWSGKRLA